MAAGALGSPGIFMISPHSATKKPAPCKMVISRTLMVKSVGLPKALGLSESEYWVFAIQMGKCGKPSLSILSISDGDGTDFVFDIGIIIIGWGKVIWGVRGVDDFLG